MQLSASGEKYDERDSKDGRFQFTFYYAPSIGTYDVDCWYKGGEYDGENKWHKSFKTEAEALAEFNRFE